MNTNKELIQKLRSQTRGYLYERWDGNPKHKTRYILIIRGVSKVYSLLSKILTALIVKKELAEYVVEYCQRRLKRKRQTTPYCQRDFEIYNKMKSMGFG